MRFTGECYSAGAGLPVNAGKLRTPFTGAKSKWRSHGTRSLDDLGDQHTHEVGSVDRSGLDVLSLSSSHFDPQQTFKQFCPFFRVTLPRFHRNLRLELV